MPRALPIQVVPAAGELVPGGEVMEVNVTVAVTDPGSVAGELTVVVGNGEPPKKLMLNATVVKQNFELLDSAGALMNEVGWAGGGAGEQL